jgi:hypothetical protein
MEKIKKSFMFIGLGLFNIFHSSLHIIQFIQSIFLLNGAMNHCEGHEHTVIEEILHSPVFAIIWGLIGIFTLIIGVKDFLHHKKCDEQNNKIIL